MVKNRRLFIIGFMGSGKTTAGKKIATLLNWTFVDLDKKIEQKTGLTIQEIFSFKGEAYFRQIESEILRELGTVTETVVSTGGGAPCYRNNMDFMLGNGLTVYLKLSPAQLKSRLAGSKTVRPLIKDLDDDQLLGYIGEKLSQREKDYSRAEVIIEEADPDLNNLLSVIRPYLEL